MPVSISLLTHARTAAVAGCLLWLGLLTGCFAKAHYSANLEPLVEAPQFECDAPIARRVRWIYQDAMLGESHYYVDGAYQAALAEGDPIEFPAPTKSLATVYAEHDDPEAAARIEASSQQAAQQMRAHQRFMAAASLPDTVASSQMSAEAGLASAALVATNVAISAAGHNLMIADIQSIVGSGIPRCMVGDSAPEGSTLYVWMFDSTDKGGRHGAQYESMATFQLRLAQGDEVIQAPSHVVEILLYRKRGAVPPQPAEGFIERDFYQGKHHHQRTVTRGALEVGLRAASVELYQALRKGG